VTDARQNLPGISTMSVFTEYFAALKERFAEEIQVGNIGEEISLAIAPKKVFELQLFGSGFQITDAVLAAWVVIIVILVFAVYFGRKRERIPTTKRQQVAETLVDLLMSLCRNSNMSEEQAEKVAPFVGSIAIFIAFTNLSSMFKIAPPAKNPAFPIALALFTVLYVIVTSIQFVGFKGFWASLTYPKKALLPFKILDYFIKPISLSLRLFGNIFGSFILMEFIFIIVPAILPGIIGLWFDLADGILQGVIFAYLSATYVGEVIEGAHMAHEAAELEAEEKAAKAARAHA
jgi:F-type H+-transporting ATPase subunit a